MKRLPRIVRWILGATMLLLIGVLFGLPLLFSTEAGRGEVAARLGEALDRDVAIGKLEVGFLFRTVSLGDLTVGNPDGFPDGHLVKAGALDVDIGVRKLLDGEIEGEVEATGIDLHILKKGGRTNLDGLAPESDGEAEEKDGEKEAADLHILLLLRDSRVTIEDLDKNEKVIVQGVDVSMTLSNRGGAQDTRIRVQIDSIDQKQLRLHDISLDAVVRDDVIEVPELSALVAQKGRLVGSAKLDATTAGSEAWHADVRLEDVGIDGAMRKLVAALYPPAAARGGPLGGVLNAGFRVAGRGMTWESVKPTLRGEGEAKLEGLNLSEQSLLGMLAQLTDRPQPLALNDAGATFKIANGWLEFSRLSASGKETRYDMGGRVSLDGKLDLTIDLKPAMERYGGGKFEKYLEYTESLDFRIKGTTEDPKIRAPELKDLARGAINDLFRKYGGDK